MTIQLEDEIRDALRTRAQAVAPGRLRYAGAARSHRPRTRRSGPWGVIAAAAAVAVLATGIAIFAFQHGRDAGRPAANSGTALADTRWRVVTVTDPGTRTAITSRRVIVDFIAGGEFHADDDVNYYSGKWRATSGGLDITNVGTTLAAYGGNDPAVLAAQRGIGALTSSTTAVRVRLASDALRLTAKGVVLDLVRDGRPTQPGGGGQPSSTASPS